MSLSKVINAGYPVITIDSKVGELRLKTFLHSMFSILWEGHRLHLPAAYNEPGILAILK